MPKTKKKSIKLVNTPKNSKNAQFFIKVRFRVIKHTKIKKREKKTAFVMFIRKRRNIVPKKNHVLYEDNFRDEKMCSSIKIMDNIRIKAKLCLGNMKRFMELLKKG